MASKTEPMDLDREVYGENVEDAFPLPTIVKIKGESIEVRPITVDMLPRLSAMVKAIGEDWSLTLIDLIEKRGPELRDLCAFLIDRPSEFVGGLDHRLYRRLVQVLFAEHADFFVLSVGLLHVPHGKPAEVPPLPGHGSTLSPSSNGTDTSDPDGIRFDNSTPTSRPLTDSTMPSG
jgi:hypothetical protein